MNKQDIEKMVNTIIDSMSDEECIMQLDQHSATEFLLYDNGVPIAVDNVKVREVLKGKGVGSIQNRDVPPYLANALQKEVLSQSRVKIPVLFTEEALHGLHYKKATVFPQQLTMASSFEPELGYKMGRAIAKEAYVNGIRETLSPVMDLARDPRYGRCEETYGEDVILSSEFATQVVKGLQGKSLDDKYSVAAEPKHYVAYGNPIGGLNCAPSTMGRRDAFCYCLPIFEAAFKDGGAMNAMCSYNSIDGVPVAKDRELLREILKKEFGMKGFVRSDMTAIAMLKTAHHVAKDDEEALKLAFNAGVDMQLYDFPHEQFQTMLLSLVQKGEIKREDLKDAARRVLRVKALLGLFDNPYVDDEDENIMGCKEHLALAREIAEKSIVLLKNDKKVLPLNLNKYKKIAVIGPNCDTIQLGDYVSASFERKSTIKGLYSVLKERIGNNIEINKSKGMQYYG